MTPQQKKLLSLARDRRNCYGENDKTSRKSIQIRKRVAIRSSRHFISSKLRDPAQDADLMYEEATIVKKKQWKKVPDRPLGQVMRVDLAREIQYLAYECYSENARFYAVLKNALLQSGWHEIDARETAKQLRGTVITQPFGEFDLPLPKGRSLLATIRTIKK